MIATKYLYAITALALLTCPAPVGAVEVDNILVQKSARKMFLRNGDETIKEYKIRLGKNPVGPKLREGDSKTPEGDYIITEHNPKSAFHRSLRISYPTPEQAETAKKNGYSAGGDIMIHGYPNYAPNFTFHLVHKFRDWTAGCIAVTDDEIEEIYGLVKDGTKIRIEP